MLLRARLRPQLQSAPSPEPELERAPSEEPEDESTPPPPPQLERALSTLDTVPTDTAAAAATSRIPAAIAGYSPVRRRGVNRISCVTWSGLSSSNEVGRDVEVHLDTGIMSGADVVAAIAMGARFTLIGRAYLYGLMAGGEAGVDRAIEILSGQVEQIGRAHV